MENSVILKIKCKRCFGNKKIMGMGSFLESCPTCDGNGYIVDKPTYETVPVDIKEIKDETITLELKPKKRGRPKKEQD